MGRGYTETIRALSSAIDAKDNLLFSDRGLVAAVGVSDLLIVRTGDAVLVMPKSRSQDVKAVVESLQKLGRRDLL